LTDLNYTLDALFVKV